MEPNIENENEKEITIQDKIFDAVKSKKEKAGDKDLIPVFDHSAFPIINVMFSSTLDRPAFDHFLKEWLNCYTKKENFTFIFNLNQIKWINPSYSLLVVKFMKQLRKHIDNLPYLKTSIIIINNDFVRGLAYYIFKIQKPISHVYLVSTKEHAERIAEGDELAKQFSVSIPPNTLLTQVS